MSDRNCLSEQELSEFVQGRITDVRVEEIAEHLEACDDCQETIVMLGEKSDTFVEQLRSPAVPDALESEEACYVAVERLAARAAEQRSGPTATYPAINDIERLGPYNITGKLGVGGMGTVFEAVHTKLKRSVAIKLLPASRWANPAAVARFEREMEVIGQLDHPNIVRASDAGEENGMHYLVMEHVDGLDLSRIVNRVGPLSIANACEVARQAAIGLQYANENHLVHRDIKPSNLMLSGSGQRSAVSGQPESGETTVKILDLGLALLGESHSAHENELTTVGQLMGTLDYMSPEQGMDSHDVDIRADIYSLGATLYKLLTGRAPFSAPQYDTLLKKVTALANKPVTPIQQLRSDIPDGLASTIDRMLAKDSSERIATPHEVAMALEPFATGADLSKLLQSALDTDESEQELTPPVIVSQAIQPTHATSRVSPSTGKPQPQVSGRMMGNFGGAIVALLLLFAGFGAAGVVFYVTTNNGQLVIRAEDDAQVMIRQDGNTVRSLEVTKGEQSVSIRSGSYRIELKGKSDELSMTQDTVSIKRGERVVVHVQRRPRPKSEVESMMDMMSSDMEKMMGGGGGDSGYGEMAGGGDVAASGSGDMMSGYPSAGYGDDMAAMSGYAMAGGDTKEMHGESGVAEFGDATGNTVRVETGNANGFEEMYGFTHPPEPTYDGKTYAQWLAELSVERKPERLTDAILAFASLGDGDEKIATESAAAIMQIMRRNGSYVIDNSPQGKLIQQAIKVLQQMPGEIVVAAIEDELESGNTRSRSFANHFLHSSFYKHAAVGSPHIDLSTAALRRSKTLYAKLLGIPDDEAGLIRADGVGLVVKHAKSRGVALKEVEGLLPKLRGMLKEKDFVILAAATKEMFELEKDNQELVPALIHLLASQDHDHRLQAVRLLGQLGPRSEAAVPALLKIIRPLAESANQAVPTNAQLGGFGGVAPGMDAGGGGFGGGYMAYDRNRDINYVAIITLGYIGPGAKAALPVLQKIAAKHPKAQPSGTGYGSDGGGEGYGSGGAGYEGGEDEMGMEGYGGEGGGGFGVSYEKEYAEAAKASIERIEGRDTSPIKPPPAAKPPGGGGFF